MLILVGLDVIINFNIWLDIFVISIYCIKHKRKQYFFYNLMNDNRQTI